MRGDDARDDAVVREACRLAEELRDPRALGELLFWQRWAGLECPSTGSIERAYALQRDGQWQEAAMVWQGSGCPYERALALMEGDEDGRAEGMATLSALEASATLKRCVLCEV